MQAREIAEKRAAKAHALAAINRGDFGEGSAAASVPLGAFSAADGWRVTAGPPPPIDAEHARRVQQNREASSKKDTAALQRRKHKKEARAERRGARAARDEKKAQEYEASKKAFARQRSESLEGASPKSKAKAAKTDDSYLGGFFRSLSSLVGVEA